MDLLLVQQQKQLCSDFTKPVSLTGTRNYDGTTIVSSKDLTVGNFVGKETLTISEPVIVFSKHQSNSSLASTVGLYWLMALMEGWQVII